MTYLKTTIYATILGMIYYLSVPYLTEAQNERLVTPVYRAPEPLRPNLGKRIGSVSRGTGEILTLSALVPDHVALTVQSQPSLYWHLSKSTTSKIEFTFIEDQAIKPLLEKNLDIANKPDIYQIRLSDYKITLKPGMIYQWSVAAVIDPDHRSNDIIATGTIERIEPPRTLRTRLDQGSKLDFPGIYADERLWYDAFSAISDLINTRPKDRALREQRAALLEQVGLLEIAAYDRKGGE
jgi:hypothetical protein